MKCHIVVSVPSATYNHNALRAFNLRNTITRSGQPEIGFENFSTISEAKKHLLSLVDRLSDNHIEEKEMRCEIKNNGTLTYDNTTCHVVKKRGVY